MTDFKDKVVYQIYPKSFKDSNGDGIGDLKGIIQKLDYLETLGVDYLWLTPFFISPQNDNGYDVADYLNIDPLFGTMDDLDQLIQEASQKNIGLMLDMVFNHTSTEHEWFKKALQGDKKYMDYYIFKEGTPDTPPTNWESKFGGSAWEYVPHLKKWYLHLFDVTQADLNWENPEVREELKNIIRFWKAKGIKGFRFDVVNLISKPEIFENDYEGDGRRFYTDGPHVHAFLKELVHDTDIAHMVTVGEMSSTSIEHCIKYSNPMEKELSMCFNFHHLKVDYKDGNKWELMPPDIKALKKLFKEWQLGMEQNNGWNAVFWCNHDQPRIVSRLGDDKNYHNASAKMLATTIHTLRGTPYIYQGEEIGMTNAYYTSIDQYKDVESLNYYQIMLERGKTPDEALAILGARSRDNGRTPMQWDDTTYAGFSTATPWLSIPENYKDINAVTALKDSNSVFYYYRQLITLRKNKKAISMGHIDFLYEDEENVFAYRRFIDEEEIIVINYFGNTEQILVHTLDLANYKVLLSNYEDMVSTDKALTLRPYESLVLEKVY